MKLPQQIVMAPSVYHVLIIIIQNSSTGHGAGKVLEFTTKTVKSGFALLSHFAKITLF